MVNDGNFINTDDLPEYLLEGDTLSHFFSFLPPNSTFKDVFGISEEYVSDMANKGFKDTLLNDNFWNEENDVPILPSVTTNELGMRSQSWLSGNPGIVTVGCSDTFGVGQYNDRIWPTLLGNELKLNVYNLAWPGASLEYCYKVLKRYLPEINSTKVFMLTPSIERLEFFYNENVGSVTGYGASELTKSFPFLEEQDASILKDYFYKFYSNPRNCILSYNRNLDAIQKVCEDNGATLYTLMNPEFGSLGHKRYFYQLFHGHPKGYEGVRKYDLAVDCKHRGKIWQWMVYDYFIKKLPK